MSTQRLADYAVGLSYEAIPRDIREATRLRILDAIGNAFAGLGTRYGKIALAYAGEFGLTGEATLIGGSGRSSAMNAAFANAVLGQAQGVDDTHERGRLHPGVPVVMTSLAVAEGMRSTGKEMMIAVIAGYDVAVRVAEAVSPWHHEGGFHPTGTCNTFGATVAAGRLLGLTEEQMVRALGLAGSQASGMRQYQVDAADNAVGAFHGARAAQNGVMAALLAKSGFPASPTILEGQYGFCETFSRTFEAARLTEGLGERFAVMETALKARSARPLIHSAGEVDRGCVDDLPGGAGNPPSAARIREKFVGHVEPLLGNAPARPLAVTVDRIDELPSVCALAALLNPDG